MTRKPTSLLDIISAYQGSETRVVKYAEDGRTPLVIENTHTDDEGTTWLTQRNLETGETRLRQIPEDR